MPRKRFTTVLLVACAWTFLATGSASAQDVKWLTDYAAARKVATETGRPLLLDFGTEACFWCKKLDATTFRDPKVVKLLNEGFVPVKIDAQRHPRMVEALKIDGFPTLILASPEGKVLGRHAGYADAAQLTALLSKAPAPVVPAAPKQPVEVGGDLGALFPEIAAKLDR
ncbi:MAG: thioredoxin family protein [Planctomycetes bacterium]|nr:thioredoxin family protein [Planctomycetota bacterium]